MNSKVITSLPGPIIIFGAGGFIGFRMLEILHQYRDDVFGIFTHPEQNWRLNACTIPAYHIVTGDITRSDHLSKIVEQYKPQTIFNFAAYGAYSHQVNVEKIYAVNTQADRQLISILQKVGCKAYIYAGSSSEYGANAKAPSETSELIPNSDYAVSKGQAALFHTYVGKFQNFPVIHLRLYAVYGPWEEPSRLVPTILSKATKGVLPPLVDPHISRDFIFVDDVVGAAITAGQQLAKGALYGNIYNICTGIKTTIADLVDSVKQLTNLSVEPVYSTMQNRSWDLKDWYGNPQIAINELKFTTDTHLKNGLQKTLLWQQEVDYNNAPWNKS